MSLELNIVSGTVSIPQEIENLEQLKSELAPKLEYYNNLVVTEDSIKEAKSDKAKLNKLKTAVEDRRKDIKKQVMGLYEPLEKQCKELTSLIDAPINAIDKQIKIFDERSKNMKFEQLRAHFDIIDKPDFIKIEDVINPKWANATMKIKNLWAEMDESINRIKADYDEIINLYKDSTLLTAIKQKYEETKDKSQTLAYATILEKQDKSENSDNLQKADYNSQEKTVSGTFKVTCTEHQLINLRDYMKNTGIKFEIIR